MRSSGRRARDPDGPDSCWYRTRALSRKWSAIHSLPGGNSVPRTPFALRRPRAIGPGAPPRRPSRQGNCACSLSWFYFRSSAHREIVLAQPQRIRPVLPDQLHNIVVLLTRDVVWNGVIGLEDEPPALSGIELGQRRRFDLIQRPGGPQLNVHVAAEPDLMAEPPAQVDHIHARFGLQRVVRVDPDFHEIGKDLVDIPTAVVNDRQVVAVTFGDQRRNPGLEMLPPKNRGEQQSLLVGYVAPDHHAVQFSAGGLDLGF